jgi:predicted dinucleotide-binding enzyme
MRIGFIGAGRIGGNCARQAVRAGHEVKLSFSLDPQTLESLAAELGPRASIGSPRDAVALGEIVVFSAGRTGQERVVQWLCGDDPAAKRLVAGLIEEMGYAPVDLGGTAGCQLMEASRRPGAVYGEEYRSADAQAVVEAVGRGAPIPATPAYG